MSLITGGLGQNQTIICRGMSQGITINTLPYTLEAYLQKLESGSYTIDGIIQAEYCVFYDIDAIIIWARRVRYFLETHVMRDMSSGYSLEATILRGSPKKCRTDVENVYHVKVPEYD